MSTQQAEWLALVQQASRDVQAARLLDAEWEPGTLEAADYALTAALGGQVPPDPSPAPTLRGVYGTYSGHGLAQDLYGGATDEQVQWGPHHGLPLVAPCRGHVELYAFGVGSAGLAAVNPAYARQHLALFAGWTCGVPALYGLQTMYVAVFWPDEPLTVDGQRIGHLHYGHVRSDVQAGPVDAGQQFATSWDSGVRFESMGVPTARAAHTHCCAGAGAQLSPNGDLDGRLAVAAQGWTTTDARTMPGPTDYASGRYCAGRLLSDFTRAGRELPPVPS